MLVGQIAVFADLHWHAATRARIAVARNDDGAITLALFLAHVLAQIESGALRALTRRAVPPHSSPPGLPLLLWGQRAGLRPR
jgi:hypothetical protein